MYKKEISRYWKQTSVAVLPRNSKTQRVEWREYDLGTNKSTINYSPIQKTFCPNKECFQSVGVKYYRGTESPQSSEGQTKMVDKSMVHVQVSNNNRKRYNHLLLMGTFQIIQCLYSVHAHMMELGRRRTTDYGNLESHLSYGGCGICTIPLYVITHLLQNPNIIRSFVPIQFYVLQIALLKKFSLLYKSVTSNNVVEFRILVAFLGYSKQRLLFGIGEIVFFYHNPIS